MGGSASSSTRPWGHCGSGSIVAANVAASRDRGSTICSITFRSHGRRPAAATRSITATRFRFLMPDAEASISEEPGARQGHAGICAGAVRATGRPTAMPARAHLQAQNETEAGVEVFHGLTSEPPGAFQQKIAVERDELGDVRHRVLRKPGSLRGNEDITGRFQQAQVGHENDGDNSAQAAAIERITLHDDHGASITWFGTIGLTKVGPPHLAAFAYHESRGSERACARRSDRSRPLSSVA